MKTCTALLPRRLEILQHVLFGTLPPLQLSRHVAAQHVIQLALELNRECQLRVRKEDPGDSPPARDENRSLGAQKPCRVPKVAGGAYPHAVVIPMTIRRRTMRGARLAQRFGNITKNQERSRLSQVRRAQSQRFLRPVFELYLLIASLSR